MGPQSVQHKNESPDGAPQLGLGPEMKAGPLVLLGGAGPQFDAPAPHVVQCGARNLCPPMP